MYLFCILAYTKRLLYRCIVV